MKEDYALATSLLCDPGHVTAHPCTLVFFSENWHSDSNLKKAHFDLQMKAVYRTYTLFKKNKKVQIMDVTGLNVVSKPLWYVVAQQLFGLTKHLTISRGKLILSGSKFSKCLCQCYLKSDVQLIFEYLSTLRARPVLNIFWMYLNRGSSNFWVLL